MFLRTLKESLPVREVAEWLGLDPDKRGRILCPFHEENEASCQLYDDHYHCYGCGAHGDVIKLLQGVLGLSEGEALTLAAKLAGVDSERVSAKPATIRSKVSPARLLGHIYGLAVTDVAVARESYKPRATADQIVALHRSLDETLRSYTAGDIGADTAIKRVLEWRQRALDYCRR